MTNQIPLDKLNEELVYEGIITVEENGDVYFLYDVYPEGTGKENWSIYCEIQEDLRRCGWELVDSYIEHDAITGYLKPKSTNAYVQCDCWKD
jgi:hypothetical protein